MEWCEKYRPTTLDEVIGHKMLIKILKGYVKNKEIKSFMLAGMYGNGKSSMIKALINDFHNNDRDEIMLNVKKFNGSALMKDDIRNDVLNFSKTKSIMGQNHKVMVFEEGDGIPPQSQAVMRVIIEEFANNTRYVLTCNYANQIIPPVRNRFIPFHVKPLTIDEQKQGLEKVLIAEGVDYTPEAVTFVLSHSKGSMREVIKPFEALHEAGEKITVEKIKEVFGYVDVEKIKTLIVNAMNNKFDVVQKTLKEIWFDSSNFDEVPQIMFDLVSKNEKIPLTVLAKSKYYMDLADCEYKIKMGCDPELQLSVVLRNLNRYKMEA